MKPRKERVAEESQKGGSREETEDRSKARSRGGTSETALLPWKPVQGKRRGWGLERMRMQANVAILLVLSTRTFSVEIHSVASSCMTHPTFNRSKCSMTSCGSKSLALHLKSPLSGPNLPSQTHLPLSCL